jgi:hypothetical protein
MTAILFTKQGLSFFAYGKVKRSIYLILYAAPLINEYNKSSKLFIVLDCRAISLYHELVIRMENNFFDLYFNTC